MALLVAAFTSIRSVSVRLSYPTGSVYCIHPVISVELLEPAPPPDNDQYNRSQPALGLLTINVVEKFVIDKIVKVEARNGQCRSIVKWLGYGNQTTFDPREDLLRDVPKLVAL